MKHMKLVSRRPLPDDLLQVLLGDAAILGGLGQFPLLHDGDEAVLEVLLNVIVGDGVLHRLQTSLGEVISRLKVVGVVLEGRQDRLECGGVLVLAPLSNRHLNCTALYCTAKCTKRCKKWCTQHSRVLSDSKIRSFASNKQNLLRNLEACASLLLFTW